MAVETREQLASFVGRGGELETLAAALERARAGRGRLVALTGEAGIGKTRLVEELIRDSALSADRVIWGRCLEQPGAPSYWPWIRVLRGLAAVRGLEQLRADLGADVALVAPLLPGLSAGGASPSGAPPAFGDAEARFLLFEALTGLLRSASRAEPLLVILEDVHWADEASQALLEFVAQELDGTRLLLVVTYRDREQKRLPRPLSEAVRRGHRIALGGLDRDAVAAIMAEATGGDASAPVVERLAAEQ